MTDEIGSQKTILIIEDNPANLELFKALLAPAGHTIVDAPTGKDGIDRATQALPNLILLDIGLPDMSGLNVAKTLKEKDETRHIPIVALSAHAMPGDAEKAIGAGCNGYITKPIDTRAFLKTVVSFITN